MPQQQFALRFPFEPINQTIEEFDFRTGELRVKVSVEDPFAVLQVSPFPNEAAATQFLPRLWGALAWMAVRVGTGFVAEMEIGQVSYADDPKKVAENLHKSTGLPNEGPVHGLFRGHLPAILPIGKNFCAAVAGSGKIVQTLSRRQIEAPLAEGLRAPEVASLYANQRLRTAIDLFFDSHRESSLRSKFLTLVMALEVLTEPSLKHRVAQDLLDRLRDDVNEGLVKFAETTDEWQALDALQRELLFRRETSIRSRIRDLVLNGLPVSNTSEREQRARDAVWAYDKRGTLVHDGTIPAADLNKAHAIARSTLLQVLRKRMQLVGQIPPPGGETGQDPADA